MNGKGDSLRKGANLNAYWSNYDNIFRHPKTMEVKNNTCNHENVRFEGLFSMIGGYVCQNCQLKIEPFVYHKMIGIDHILFHKDNIEDLNEMVKNLDEENSKIWNS